MSDIKNLYNDLVNFYNVNDENFKEFMACIYKEMLANHRDVKYVKEHLHEEIVKILDEYLVDGKIGVNIQQKVEEFLNNGDVINLLDWKLIQMTVSICYLYKILYIPFLKQKFAFKMLLMFLLIHHFT